VSVDHYENFPVASWLCPPRLRPDVIAIYRFARTADDIADEGDAKSETRLADLTAYRADLLAAAGGNETSARWREVFTALRATLVRHDLPLTLLLDLLSAFEQDARAVRYADRSALLDYCRRSANPVGRLMLHLYGIRDATALSQSDSICTALQLINFWQDLGVDMRRGRYYVPESDCARRGVAAPWEWDDADTAGTRAIVSDLIHWSRSIMHQGMPLVHRIAGRAGWELRVVVQGGLRILDQIERIGGATIEARPVLRFRDAPLLLWRAALMQDLRNTPAVETR
jgi:hydroxysqualene synthase